MLRALDWGTDARSNGLGEMIIRMAEEESPAMWKRSRNFQLAAAVAPVAFPADTHEGRAWAIARARLLAEELE